MNIFQADMAGLGKYCTGGYGRIGVYRVIIGNTEKQYEGPNMPQGHYINPGP